MCYFTVESVHQKANFLQEIRMTFGSGGFTCAFSDKELVEFHQFLEDSFPHNDANRVKKGVACAGKQTGTDIWVLNREVQVNGIGNQIDLADSNFVWQPVGGPCIKTTMGKGSIALDLEAEIMLPLQSMHPLHQLLTTMQAVLKHNFIAGKLT